MCAQNGGPASRSAGRQMSGSESSCPGRRSLSAAAPQLFETSKHQRRVLIITNHGHHLRYSAHGALLGGKKKTFGICRRRLLGVKNCIMTQQCLHFIPKLHHVQRCCGWVGEGSERLPGWEETSAGGFGLLHNSSDVKPAVIADNNV